MANRGVAPLDPNTLVGQFRIAAGDAEYKEFQPTEFGYGDYAIWSDAEIEAYLRLAGDKLPRAIAIGYRQLAASWVSLGATIKTDDLTYSSKDTVGQWIQLADYWDKIANDSDASSVDDYFDLVQMGRCASWPPEASPQRVATGKWWY